MSLKLSNASKGVKFGVPLLLSRISFNASGTRQNIEKLESSLA
jgi:hypothetical protein